MKRRGIGRDVSVSWLKLAGANKSCFRTDDQMICTSCSVNRGKTQASGEAEKRKRKGQNCLGQQSPNQILKSHLSLKVGFSCTAQKHVVKPAWEVGLQIIFAKLHRVLQGTAWSSLTEDFFFYGGNCTAG